jgi:large subunit ribosomal protein L30
MKTLKKKLKVTLIGSLHGRKPKHKACVTGLGLRRRHHSVFVEETPAVRGMINKVAYLLKVEESA